MVVELIIFLPIFQPPYSVNTTCSRESAGLSQSLHRSDEVAGLLTQVRSGNASHQRRAKRRLILLARKSNALRNRIVGDLITFLNKPSLQNKILSSQDFRSFTTIGEILGELKATEALATLIACLDCNDGTHGESASRNPATIAVAQMGEEAIPHLARALSQEWVGIKALAAQTLGMIGGDRAKEVLERALLTEKDEEIMGAIRIALHGISRKTS